MWAYLVRRVLYYIPLYLSILLAVMLLLRVNMDSAVAARLGKNPSAEQIALLKKDMGLDRPIHMQYLSFLGDVVTLRFEQRSWDQKLPVGEMVRRAIPPTLMITIPELTITATLAIAIGLLCSYNRGRWLDRGLMFVAVLGMSVSHLVFIILGQYFGAFWLTEKTGVDLFAVRYDADRLTGNLPADWVKYFMLPVMISVIVSMGYDTRFYRTVIVEQTNADYIRTARAKGCSQSRVMFIHLLRNAMIPIITRVMITMPFLIVGSLLLEVYFSIPGMGATLLTHMQNKDFAVTQTIVAILAAIFIISNILTDVLYAIVDPRVRLS